MRGNVYRCDGCGVEVRGEPTNWWELDNLGETIVKIGNLLRVNAPYQFCRLACLTRWASEQEVSGTTHIDNTLTAAVYG